MTRLPEHRFEYEVNRDCSCGWKASPGSWDTGEELEKLWREHEASIVGRLSEGDEVWVRCIICHLQSEPLSEQTHIEVAYHGFGFFASREDVGKS